MKKNNTKLISDEHAHSHVHDTSQEYEIRIKKLEKMRAVGIDPWPTTFPPITATCQSVHDEFDQHADTKEYCLSGRIMTVREHGKTTFVTLQDDTGSVQLYIKSDLVGDTVFTQFKDFIDTGDIIWCTGKSFRTKMGEVTVKVTDLKLLSKCLHPLPDKFHGIADIEIKYRHRYLDLITSNDTKERFKKRFYLIQIIRSFLQQRGFIEVETPMLHPIPGGTIARPFVTHHNTLDTDLYLRIAPELYLKRLIVGGFSHVFEINRSFRNEGISTKHNPEFTMLELYAAYHDYHYGMDLMESLFKEAAQLVVGTLSVPYGEHVLDMESPFQRISMIDAVAQYASCKREDLSEDTIASFMKERGIEMGPGKDSWGYRINQLFEIFAEPHLIQPTFITDYPVEVSPLAKKSAHDDRVTDRFELFVAGMELSNGFSELNDPFDQAKRFKQQVQSRDAGDAEAHHYDADYIYALEYGLPPTVGLGFGVDRLAMILTNTTSIRDIVLFPTLKAKR